MPQGCPNCGRLGGGGLCRRCRGSRTWQENQEKGCGFLVLFWLAAVALYARRTFMALRGALALPESQHEPQEQVQALQQEPALIFGRHRRHGCFHPFSFAYLRTL